jgi:serine protein kinase
LSGDINYRNLQYFGADSDPRAFSFDGEFCVANRGCFEVIEMLKLQQEFLYDFLGASQEQQIKPKKFPQIDIDSFIIGHTNNPEFVKLQNNDYMEAIRDRTVKIDVPYLLEIDQEIKIYEQDYGEGRVKQHIAPHTLEIAASWAVLTRLKDEGNLELMDKADLYNGKILHGWNEDRVKEVYDKHEGDEGIKFGVSARYVQDKMSNCLSDKHPYVGPFTVINELKRGLKNHPAFKENADLLKRFTDCANIVIERLGDILKREVQKALVSNEEAIHNLCKNYIDNLYADMYGTKVKNPYTEREEEPNEELMRSIEEKIEISESKSPDFRKMIASSMGKLQNEGKQFNWDSNLKLKQALEAKLFEDCKHTIKLSALNVSGATVVDEEHLAKVDAITQRLIEQHGYTAESARDVLDYVGSIFARGDLASE